MKLMKTLCTALVLVIAVTAGYAQVWFDAGVKGGYGPTVLLNKNIFDDRNYDHQLTSGFMYGAKLGVHFGYHNGFTIDYARGTSKQNFDFDNSGTMGINEYKWIHNDVMLLFRHSGDGAYIEIGPRISFVKEVSQTTLGSSEMDVTGMFEDYYPSAVFGFGSYLAGSDLASVQLGVRLTYAFTDFVSEQGQENDYIVYPGPTYPDYAETRAFSAQMMIEFNYAFGRFARTSCAHRWKLILFE